MARGGASRHMPLHARRQADGDRAAVFEAEGPWLIHQVVVAQLAAARQGTDQEPRRGPRRWPQAVPPEVGTGRPARVDPRAAVRRWWRRARSDAARVRSAHPEEDEGCRPAWRPLRPGAQRAHARRLGCSRATPRPRRPPCRCCRPASASTCSWSSSGRRAHVQEPAQRLAGPHSGRPAQHLRRARLRRRGLLPRRPRRVPRGRSPAKVRRAKAAPPSETEAPERQVRPSDRPRTTAIVSRRSSRRRATGSSTRTSTRSWSHRRANKTEIKDRRREGLRRQGHGVNTINRVGKRKRTRTGFGRRTATKRAIVTAEGDRIDIFEPAASGRGR